MMVSYGGPETRKMEAATSQIAASSGLLTRGNVCLSDAQDIDFQAGSESTFNLIPALASGINYLPGCGIAGGGCHCIKGKTGTGRRSCCRWPPQVFILSILWKATFLQLISICTSALRQSRHVIMNLYRPPGSVRRACPHISADPLP